MGRLAPCMKGYRCFGSICLPGGYWRWSPERPYRLSSLPCYPGGSASLSDHYAFRLEGPVGKEGYDPSQYEVGQNRHPEEKVIDLPPGHHGEAGAGVEEGNEGKAD